MQEAFSAVVGIIWDHSAGCEIRLADLHQSYFLPLWEYAARQGLIPALSSFKLRKTKNTGDGELIV